MLIITIIIFLLFSAFFSSSEIAFVSASKLGVEVLKNKGDRRGKILARFYERPRKFISSMLVGNNISLVVFTIFMNELLLTIFTDFEENSVLFILLSTLIITIVVLIFGEFLPKTFARLFSNSFLHAVTYPLSFFNWLLAIPTWIVTVMSNGILKSIFKQPVENAEMALTRVDLEHFIEEQISEQNEDIDKEILTNALNLNQRKVRECMIPRTEIIDIDKSDSIADLLEVFKSSNLSRIIVTDGDIENVIGYVHHQQLLDNPKSIRKIMMKMPYVPEAMNVQDLMMAFMKEGTNIACVVDEFGGTAGLITMEDILEEIFGEIEDEHDEEEVSIEMISEIEFLFNGRVELDHINEKYEQLNIPEGEYHTLSGYLVMTSGEIPEEGTEIELDGYKFTVEEVSDTKIERIRVLKLELDEQ